MFTIHKKELKWGNETLTLETGHMSRQADGSVVATYGGTVVHASACYAREPKAGIDFFPLTVNYQEKFYAGGRIPGGFFKREGRPTEKETLVSRLIDRPIRPLFAKGFKNETQVIITVLSTDGVNDPDVVGMVAAGAALSLSGAPFLGPIAGARVGYVDGEYVLNPSFAQQDESDLDLMVAGTDEGVLMVESEADELSEDVMLGAVVFGHEACKPVIKMIQELADVAGKPAYEMPEMEDLSDLEETLSKEFSKGIVSAYKIKDKQERVKALSEVKQEALDKHAGAEDEHDEAVAEKVSKIMKSLQADALRGDVLKSKKRIDGRKPTDVRPIVAEVDILPRSHGSALFTRGETQALVVTTLGGGRDEQIIDAPEGEYKDAFMLHYNFPPYCVGEVGRMGSPGRREIGHGRLARRSLERLLPSTESFPYTIRVVSEIMESNGSSSMASVCGSSMAMMAAGVPLPRPVAGIAMGLVKENDDYVVLSDIMGDEDHLGDMDFKVAGSEKGITALQMDIKITSITKQIMEEALKQANGGRMHILGEMAKAITESRNQVSDYAPAMETFPIDKEEIRTVIGPGGKMIRQLQEDTGCDINIDDDGNVTVSSVSRAGVRACVEQIKGLVAKPEVGETYTGPVTGTPDFGAFVKILPNCEGLLHISEIAEVRVGHINDVVEEGDEVTVKVVEMDDRGKIRLSMKGVEQEGDVATRLEELIANGGSESNVEDMEDRRPRRDDNKGGRGRGRGPRRRSA